jgi:hypothetical protein
MADRPPGLTTVPAGGYADWLARFRAALVGDGTMDVPCGACTACCRSSQFVHVEPDELDALARIPGELLFPAPGRPRGHRVLGYDEQGRCPMLVDDRCSIYEHRPRACRAYDCRVYAATGVAVDVSQPSVAERVARWRFDVSTGDDRAAREEVQASVATLASSPRPPTGARLAVEALVRA